MEVKQILIFIPPDTTVTDRMVNNLRRSVLKDSNKMQNKIECIIFYSSFAKRARLEKITKALNEIGINETSTHLLENREIFSNARELYLDWVWNIGEKRIHKSPEFPNKLKHIFARTHSINFWWFSILSRHSFMNHFYYTFCIYSVLAKWNRKKLLAAFILCNDFSDYSYLYWQIKFNVIGKKKNPVLFCLRVLKGLLFPLLWYLKLPTLKLKSVKETPEFPSEATNLDVLFIGWGYWKTVQGKLVDHYYSLLPEYLVNRGLKAGMVFFDDTVDKNSLSSGTKSILFKRDSSFFTHTEAVLDFYMQFTRAMFRLLFVEDVGAKPFLHGNKKLFIELLKNAPSVFQYISLFRDMKMLLDLLTPSVVVFYDESYHKGRALEMAVKNSSRKRIKTVGFQHGWFSENHLTYNLFDVNYKIARDDFRDYAPGADYWFVYGDYLAKHIQKWSKAEPKRVFSVGSSNIIIPHKPLELPNAFNRELPVFLLTGQEPDKNLPALKVFMELASEYHVQLVIKPHPACPWSREMRNMWRDTSQTTSVFFYTTKPIEEVVAAVDYVVLDSSTVFLNALAQGKKIIKYFLKGEEDHYMLADLLEGHFICRDMSEFKKVITRIVTSNETGSQTPVDTTTSLLAAFGKESMELTYNALVKIKNNR